MSLVTVIENNVLSQGQQREVRHIEFDWSGEVYNPGDVVMVQPQMPAHDRYPILPQNVCSFCSLIPTIVLLCLP